MAKIERQRAERAAFARGLGRVVGQPDATRFDAHVLAFRAQEAKRSRAKHNAHVVAYSRWLKTADGYRWRYRNNPEFAIKERLRRQLRKKAEGVPGLAEAIRQAIKHGKSPSSKVETALGYSVAELKVHIERQFTKGMSWDAWTRGGIHIDHILPRKCFDVATMEGIRAYWALSNLRPLWAKHNLQKLDKVQFLL